MKPVLAASPNVVISEVYGGGGNSGATLTNDFIELFNRGAQRRLLNGLVGPVRLDGRDTWDADEPHERSRSRRASRIWSRRPAVRAARRRLPTPDASGTIAMSATAGKVALLNTQITIIASACAEGPTVVDVLGYGTLTNCSETAPDGEPLEHDSRGAHRLDASTPIAILLTSRSVPRRRRTRSTRSTHATAMLPRPSTRARPAMAPRTSPPNADPLRHVHRVGHPRRRHDPSLL